MDKEKQIEEMNDIISCCWNTISAAKKLYNAGYRKVPDGAVVLLIGENNQALDEKTIEYFVKHNEQIRKETAKKIISAMKTMIINRRADERSGLNSVYTTYSPEQLFYGILEYVRITIGVEVDE